MVADYGMPPPEHGHAASRLPARRVAERQGRCRPQLLDGNSFRVLRCYLYAAAVSGASMAQLAGWINGRSREPLKILENHPDTPDGWAVDLAS